MTPASERFRKITGHGVIPAPSGAGALLLHAEDGLDCLLVLGVFRPADKAQLTAIVTFEGCLQSVFGYLGVSKKRPAYRQVDVRL